MVSPNTAKEYLQPMKWIYDRPAQAVHNYAQKYRSDIPIRTTELMQSAELIVPGFRVDLYTLNFGEAAELKAGEEILSRADGWTIGNHLWIIPPCDNDHSLSQWWLKSVAPLPKTELLYRERLAFSDTHEKVDQDFIQLGGDTGDMEAAFAEQDQVIMKEQKDTSFRQSHIQCTPCVFQDVNGYVTEE